MFQARFQNLAQIVSALFIFAPSAHALETEKNDKIPDWGVRQTSTPEAWRITKGRPEIVVAVIDTGIDSQHPDLKSSLWLNPGETGVDSLGRDKSKNKIDDDGNGHVDDVHGWDFAANSPILKDDNGHGTHIAGIVCRLAPKVKLMVLKYYDAHSSGVNNLKHTIAAIRYATAMGADIINYSGGGRERSFHEMAALLEAEKKGILVIAAAGNEKSDTDLRGFFPASYELSNIIAVTAVDPQARVLASSNFGRKSVDIAAPGHKIYSTLPGGRYGYMTGTSQATAFVTGAAALVLSRGAVKPGFTQVRQALEQTGLTVANLKGKTQFGTQLDSYRALVMRPAGLNAFDIQEKNGTALDATPFVYKN